MKRCTKCGIEKPPEEFYCKKTGRDGRAAQCKACARKYARIYQETYSQENKERVRRCRAARSEAYWEEQERLRRYAKWKREERRATVRRWKKADWEKWAIRAVNKA